MAIYLILDAKGRVLNRISWDGVSAWEPPPGTTLLQEPDGGYVAPDLRTLDEAKAEAKARIAAQRYEVETGGITLPDGSAIRTDRESQALINGAYNMARDGYAAAVDFKGADGWVSIPAATMLQIAVAVGQHVQSCFSRERALSVQIDAATNNAAADAVTF